MKTIAYYVTDSGFGHLTRSVAIVKHILKNSDYNVIFACSKRQNNVAKVGLIQYEKRVSFFNTDTDVNSAFYENSLEVNIEETKENIEKYLSEIEENMEQQYSLLKGMEIVMVITDISILGIMIGKKLRVPVIGISNYTWYNRFVNLGIEEELISIYKKWYNQLDVLYRFKYSDEMVGLECPMEDVGLVAREPNYMSSGDLRKMYWPAVYLSVGQVENKKEKFNIDFPNGTIFATGAIEVEGHAHLVKLPDRVTSTQDYIAASSFAIIKGGWSTVAECLIMDIPFGIMDQGETEDRELVDKLVSENLCFKVSENDVRNFDMKDMNIKAISVSRPGFENDANNIAIKMLSHIK